MTAICEDSTLIRVDIAQGIQGRVDVYMNICGGECATHTHTHTWGRVVVEVLKIGVSNMERNRK